MIRNLVNISNSDVILSDMNGLVIGVGETVNGLAFEEATLINSVTVAAALLDGSLKLNDGLTDYFKMDAINFMKGLATQFTRDGKPITTVSDRPKDFFRHFTGAGDDIVNRVIGAGEPIHMIAGPGQTATVDAHFVDDVYVKDGEIYYLNAGFDSHLTIEVICPAGTPFPAPNNGTLDLTSTGFVANNSGTGAYMTATVEVTLYRFLNRTHVVGNENRYAISSPEPFLMRAPYFLRYTLQVDPEITGVLKAAVTMGMYRKKTV